VIVGLGCRQQHQPPYARGDRLGHEPGDACLAVDVRPQVGLQNVGGGDAVERGEPGGRVIQVEGDVAAGAGRRTYRQAGGPETPDDAAAGLAGAADDEDVLHASQETPGRRDDPWENVANAFVIVYRRGGVDVLSDLLHRARAKNAVVRQLIQRPPWSLTFADAPPLTVVTTLGGRASIRLEDAGAAPVHLAAGDIALISGTVRYTIADGPSTPPQVVIHGQRKHVVDGDEEAARTLRSLAPRTYGDGLPGATIMLRGAYELRGDVGDRLLNMLPPLAVVPAGPRTRAALDLLTTEITCDEPGQDAVLDRLLDLVLVLALRAWCARPESALPAWYRALAEPAIGDALRLLHADPAHRWTVAALAAKVGMSRAAFAARFAGLVGEPPLTYLTGWRMTLAADLLRDTESTVATVARNVGYEDAFAFSVAFKRARGVSPSAWRRQAH
jgi:AraC-like DNA-binding protein